MKFGKLKYWGAFGAGILWGIVLTIIIGVLYLRSSLLREIPLEMGFDDAVSTLNMAVKQNKNWSLKPTTACPLPKPADACRVLQFKLCHGKFAKELLDDPSNRKIAAAIPCSLAIYEKPDGKTYFSHFNVALLGQLIGGLSGEVFPSKIAPQQDEIYRSLTEKPKK